MTDDHIPNEDDPTRIEDIVPAEWISNGFIGDDFPELEEPIPAVVNWRTINDDLAQRALAELTGWVAWFVHRYRISSRKIPDCWHEHDALVEELSALHGAWKVAFTEAEAGNGPIAWHERMILCLGRITELHYGGECSRSEGHYAGARRSPLPASRAPQPN